MIDFHFLVEQPVRAALGYPTNFAGSAGGGDFCTCETVGGFCGPAGWPASAGGERRTRISIFLSVLDVHVNRSPIAGVVRDVRYQRGRFLNAMNAVSAEHNEQNIVTLEGSGQVVIFKQIAGLLARRIVFYPKVGDLLQRGQRVGLIKFGSRVDVLVGADARLQVKVGDRVRGGSTVIAYLPARSELVAAGGASAKESAR